jgi:flagella basal body P-ring formation protein FlgA
MLALLLSASMLGQPASVVLRADARILGPTVELDEVAEVRSDDDALFRRLSKLSIGPAPAPGVVRGLRRDEVAAAVRAAGLDVATTGAALCRAKAEIETVPAAQIDDAARTALAALFAGRDAEIALVRGATDLAVPAAELRRELFADLARREAQPGSWSVPVDVRVDGVRVQTAWVALDVQLFEQMPVAARELRRGEAVDAACWTLQRSRVEAAGPRPVAPALLAGATCTRDVAAGARISELDVRRDPLVRNGDLVELEVLRGPIRARSRAVARGQGALGDRVEVQTGEGQRRLVGIVVERGLVRVELAASPRNAR